MKQILPKAMFFVGTGATSYSGLLDGRGDTAATTTFGIQYAKCPIPIDGILRNLTIYSRDALRLNNVTVTVMVNGIASALAVTLLTADDVATNSTDEVAIVAGDDVTYRFVTTSVGLPNSFAMACSVEFDGAAMVFSLCYQATLAPGDGIFGGAFGNGQFMGYTGASGDSNTFSICAVNGIVSGLCLKAYGTPPGIPGIWNGYLRKNRILQDGSGGTVDTHVALADPAAFAVGAFSLPVVAGDYVDAVVIRTVAESGSSAFGIALGIAVTPAVTGQFMLCGGSNDVVSSSLTWKWNRSAQLADPETANLAPVGPAGFRAFGLYIDRGTTGTDGDGYTHTLRHNEADTPLIVPVVMPATTGSILAIEDYAAGDTIDLQSAPIATPTTSQLHWGLALSLVPPEGTVSEMTCVRPATQRLIITGSGFQDTLTLTGTDQFGNPLEIFIDSVTDTEIAFHFTTTQYGEFTFIVTNADSQQTQPIRTTSRPCSEVVRQRRLRRATHISDENQWAFYSSFTLDYEAGVGLTIGQGSDPELLLRWSDDGGHIWSDYHSIKVGKIGAYKHRAIWRRLGRSRSRIFEVVCSDPIKLVLIDGFLEVEGGIS